MGIKKSASEVWFGNSLKKLKIPFILTYSQNYPSDSFGDNKKSIFSLNC